MVNYLPGSLTFDRGIFKRPTWLLPFNFQEGKLSSYNDGVNYASTRVAKRPKTHIPPPDRGRLSGDWSQAERVFVCRL